MTLGGKFTEQAKDTINSRPSRENSKDSNQEKDLKGVKRKKGGNLKMYLNKSFKN